MLQASAEKITLEFKRPAGTSRGVLKTKNSWIIKVWNSEDPSIIGIGEASIIEGLSPDWNQNYETKLAQTVENISSYKPQELTEFPSMHFAMESALLDLKNGGNQLYFQSGFTKKEEGIRINGLIWMGDKEFMLAQIREKIDAGFSCLKLKIGAIDFDSEIEILKHIRAQFSSDTLELRVDANGAFGPKGAQEKLGKLSKFSLHSIEQPIRQGQWKEMHALCRNTPIPIALDEELIGLNSLSEKQKMLEAILPQYVILKPSLIGGFSSSKEWIDLANFHNIGWWITSALESNIGLNAIAQFTAAQNNPMPQGLGTGQIFSNNIDSYLIIEGERLFLKKL